MRPANDENQVRGLIQKHAVTIIASCILGFTIWQATTTYNMSLQMVRQTEKVNSIEQRLTDFRVLMNSRYRKEDAERDLRLRDEQIRSIRRRLDQIETDRHKKGE